MDHQPIIVIPVEAVIPAEAGIQGHQNNRGRMDARFREHDEVRDIYGTAHLVSFAPFRAFRDPNALD